MKRSLEKIAVSSVPLINIVKDICMLNYFFFSFRIELSRPEKFMLMRFMNAPYDIQQVFPSPNSVKTSFIFSLLTAVAWDAC